jgi:hypothetical protein
MARRRFWRPGAACLALALLVALTPLATPYGTQIFHYYGELLANKTISRAEAEWHSPVFGQLSFVIFAVPLALVLGSLVVSLIKRSKPPPSCCSA